MTGEAAWGRGRHWNTVGPLVQPHPPLDRNAIGNTAIMPLASFMVVIPSADLSAAAGNPFLLGVLGRRQSGRDDSSSYDDKEKYEHSKWHVHRCQALRFLRRFRRRSRGEDIARTCESEWSHGTAATVLSAVRLTHSSARWLSYPTVTHGLMVLLIGHVILWIQLCRPLPPGTFSWALLWRLRMIICFLGSFCRRGVSALLSNNTTIATHVSLLSRRTKSRDRRGASRYLTASRHGRVAGFAN